MRFAWLLLTMSAIGTPAHAQRNDEPADATNDGSASEIAAQAFWKGKAHYEAGELSEAIEQFKLAYGLTNDPDLLYNIAQSYRKAGECSLALAHYREFLELAPESPLASQADKQVAALRGTCENRASTPNASEKPVADTAPKQVNVAAIAPQQLPRGIVPPPFEAPEVRPSRIAETWALIAVSGAAIGGGVALGLKLWNAERHEEWEARDRELAKGNAPGETDVAWAARQATNDELARSIERVNREASYVSIGVGALLATSAILYLLKSPPVAPAARGTTTHSGHGSPMSMRLGPQSGGLAIIGAF